MIWLQGKAREAVEVLQGCGRGINKFYTMFEHTTNAFVVGALTVVVMFFGCFAVVAFLSYHYPQFAIVAFILLAGLGWYYGGTVELQGSSDVRADKGVEGGDRRSKGSDSS